MLASISVEKCSKCASSVYETLSISYFVPKSINAFSSITWEIGLLWNLPKQTFFKLDTSLRWTKNFDPDEFLWNPLQQTSPKRTLFSCPSWTLIVRRSNYVTNVIPLLFQLKLLISDVQHIAWTLSLFRNSPLFVKYYFLGLLRFNPCV